MGPLVSARLPTPLEWFLIAMLADIYKAPFNIYTANGSVITGVPLK